MNVEQNSDKFEKILANYFHIENPFKTQSSEFIQLDLF